MPVLPPPDDETLAQHGLTREEYDNLPPNHALKWVHPDMPEPSEDSLAQMAKHQAERAMTLDIPPPEPPAEQGELLGEYHDRLIAEHDEYPV